MAVGINRFLQLGQTTITDAMGYIQRMTVADTVFTIPLGDKVDMKELVPTLPFVINVQIK